MEKNIPSIIKNINKLLKSVVIMFFVFQGTLNAITSNTNVVSRVKGSVIDAITEEPIILPRFL